jgi:hypothetical protein
MSSIHTLTFGNPSRFYKHCKLNNANYSNKGHADVLLRSFRQVLKLREISWLLLLAFRNAEMVASKEY